MYETISEIYLLLTEGSKDLLKASLIYGTKSNSNLIEPANWIWGGLLRGGQGVGHFVLRKILEEKEISSTYFVDNIINELYFEGEDFKVVLEQAKQAADKLGHNYIGTEHILLGLLETKGGIAFCERIKVSKKSILTDIAVTLGQHIEGASLPDYQNTLEEIKQVISELPARSAINKIKELVNSVPY